MPLEDDDLREADRRVAEAQHHVEEQRERVKRLRANGADTADAEQMLAAFEVNLNIFEENRQLVAEERRTLMADKSAAHGEASDRSKGPSRIMEFGESLRERLSKFR
jgi:hypothetical protein